MKSIERPHEVYMTSIRDPFKTLSRSLMTILDFSKSMVLPWKNAELALTASSGLLNMLRFKTKRAPTGSKH